MSKTITITEYEEIYIGKVVGGEAITAEQFDCLENFVTVNSNKEGSQNNIMQVFCKQDKKAIIPSRYVGTITLLGGTKIEILPKIYGSGGRVVAKDTARRIFNDMLSISAGKTISCTSGEFAVANLYDMGDLFAIYITKKIKMYLQRNNLSYSIWSKLDGNVQNISISPDMVITNNINGKTYLIDTKWKLLSEIEAENGVSQSDMYQMYAYFKEYEAHDKNPQSITLIYPYAGVIKNEDNTIGNITVMVRYINLLDIDDSVDKIIVEML